MDNTLMKNDSQLVINSIQGRIKVPGQIINYVIDILTLAWNFNIVQFNYCNRSQNFLVHGIAK